MSDAPDTLTPAVQAMLDAAAPLVGLHYPDPAYLAAVAPGESAARAAAMGQASGCALVWRGLVGQLFEVQLAPYVDGSAFEVLWLLAAGSPWHPGGAVRIPDASSPPAVGDAIVYDRSPSGASPQHVDAVVTAADYDGSTLALRAFAGGQRIAGAEGVVEVSRSLRWSGGRWYDSGTGRPVMACVSPDGLAALHGLRGAARADADADADAGPVIFD